MKNIKVNDMQKISSKEIEDIPTRIICRQGNKYLNSLTDLPNKVTVFLSTFPYAASLTFAIGADAIRWANHGLGLGWNFMIDGISDNQRNPGFPIWTLYNFGGYQYEMQLISELGYNYELKYLREKGYRYDGYSYATANECIQKYNSYCNKRYMPLDDISKYRDGIVICLIETIQAIHMLLDGTGKVPEILIEKRNILNHISDYNNFIPNSKMLLGSNECNMVMYKLQNRQTSIHI